MADIRVEHMEPGETVLFDKRHSLWEIWRNFIIGGMAIVGLVLLLTKFKPGSSDTGETSWGYIILISILALFLVITYGAVPLFKRRRIKEQGRIFPITIMIVAAGAWIALIFFRDNENFADIWTTLAWIAFAVVIVGWLIYPILKWYFTHFILTDRRLMLNWGILNKKSKIIPLDQINDISSSQNLFERIFNFGDVVMESAGEFGQQPFTNIGDPIKVRTLILQQRREFEEGQASRSGREMASEVAKAMQQGAAPAAPAQAETQPAGKDRDLDVVEGLSKLDSLRSSGALTEEEFQEAKKELLDKLHEE
jgi:membrane protein YdbS with pleckstrin-like domain